MLILGITGGMDRLHETEYARYNKDIHDSAAVLIEGGKVVAAIEQERIDRIKHSNKFPAGAIRFCLKQRGIRLSDLDRIALVNREETYARYTTWLHFTLRQDSELLSGVEWAQKKFEEEFGETVPENKISFVGHHLAHSMSGFSCSGFDRSLVVTLDGLGDAESGTIRLAERETGIRLLREYTAEQSLGVFYQRVAYYLGFKAFSEFKVMGLAPYGDASQFRRFFEAAYTILPDGNYQSDFTKLFPLLNVVKPRKPSEPFSQQHMDIAAALQEMVEKIVFSILHHYHRQTQEPCLTLSGGVAHNCTLNGKILYSGMFEKIYVQPAAHDGGLALGAALSAFGEMANEYGSPLNSSNVYWGQPIEFSEAEKELSKWNCFITVESLGDNHETAEKVARLLAENKVIGWVQGRSEFGPRALGNRSILADPRPAINKDIINRMVKKREAFRPFAPAVLKEHLHEYFDVPDGVADLSFMTFVVRVKKDKQNELGAITHVDGTARVQTVSKDTNQLFWYLIDCFRKETGVPVLLNTSFNNNAEPIVESVEDSIVCYLTTGLHHLVVGHSLVTKHPSDWKNFLSLFVSLKGFVSLNQTSQLNDTSEFETLHLVCHQNSMPATWKETQKRISPELYQVLQKADGKTNLGDLINQITGGESLDEEGIETLVEELESLWSGRLVRLYPEAHNLR